jgi:hypothetical protein
VNADQVLGLLRSMINMLRIRPCVRHGCITAKGALTMPESGSKAPQGRPRTVTNPASKGLRRGLYASPWTSSGKPIA